MKAATADELIDTLSVTFQSTPPVKAATSHDYRLSPATAISIHAAREGGDGGIAYRMPQAPTFQSTPPVKAATDTAIRDMSDNAFQSTPPVKAATI